MDLATRKIIGRAMREHMRTELTLSALRMAGQRSSRGLIHHSDRGSQYAAGAYVGGTRDHKPAASEQADGDHRHRMRRFVA